MTSRSNIITAGIVLAVSSISSWAQLAARPSTAGAAPDPCVSSSATPKCVAAQGRKRAYDRAMQAGMSSATMGMLITPDAVASARKGVAQNFGQAVVGPATMDGVDSSTPTSIPGMLQADKMVVCTHGKAVAARAALGRALNSVEVRSIVAECTTK